MSEGPTEEPNFHHMDHMDDDHDPEAEQLMMADDLIDDEEEEDEQIDLSGAEDPYAALEGNPDLQDLFDPNNPDIAPVQQKIKDQLLAQNHEIFLAIKEITNEIKQLNENRETTGVDLYSMQQTLAKLQERQERAMDDLQTISRIREQAEDKRNEFVQACDERKKEFNLQKQNFQKYKVENDKLSEKLLQVEKYNDQMLSDIKVKRRVTYETENQMQQIEKEKKKQDLLIDTMNEQIKQLQIDISEYETLLDKQQQETNLASETLAEAITEMEAMSFEKKQLMQRWRSSLIGMQRRDEALKAIAEGLHKQSEQLKEIENEIEGLKTQIQKEKDLNEQLTQQDFKINAQLNHIQNQIKDTRAEIEAKHNEYNNYQRTLEQTELETRKEQQNGRKIRGELDSLDKECHRVAGKIRELEDQQLMIVNDQTTFRKGKQSTVREIEKVTDMVRNREVEIAQVENELARIKIDRLQTDNHNTALKQILSELEKELRERDKLIEKYEAEIKKKHLEIEKKQNHLDKLNRELESLTANQQEENYGPLEATIKNLEKEIDAKTKENEQLKKDWTRNQAELVELMNAVEELETQIKDLESQNTILSQKRLRLQNKTQTERDELKDLNNGMKNMHNDMTKLNNLIAKNADLQKQIADENYDLENQIMNRLQGREKEAVGLEEQVKSTREAKRELLNELVEVEKQIMYWEKKIDIQKEIQESLDPEVGQEEITKMRKEIHIMEQRLLELKRSKKKKIEEISKSISKRDIIITKGKAQSKKQVDTKASVKKEISRLNQTLNQKKKESTQLFKEIRDLQQRAEQFGVELQRQRQDEQNARHEKDELERTLELLHWRKTIVRQTKDLEDRHHQKLETIRDEKYRSRWKSDEDLDREMQKQQELSQKLENVMKQMKAAYPGSNMELIFT